MFGAMAEAVATEELVGGKYRLTRVIGRGGMGTVWEGVHTSLSTQVAVKFIDTDYADSEELRRRFVNEARAAAQLQSKHVIQVHDQGVMEDGRPFIVMEYLTGEALDKRLDRLGTLPPKDVARIILHICRGLSKAHAAGIIHRDLKPENVFLVWDDEDNEDVAKVVDFGIAKFVDEGLVGSSATRTGSLLGTPFYMSPEQARGLRSIDVRSDLWSVGVIAHRCLVGKLPFEGEAFGDMLVKICTGDTPVPSQKADVPEGFDAFIARALAKQPDERFQTARELAESLATVCGLSMPTSTREFTAPPSSGARGMSGTTPISEGEGATENDSSPSVSVTRVMIPVRPRWPWALAMLVTVGIVLLVAWAVSSDDSTEPAEAEIAAETGAAGGGGAAAASEKALKPAERPTQPASSKVPTKRRSVKSRTPRKSSKRRHLPRRSPPSRPRPSKKTPSGTEALRRLRQSSPSPLTEWVAGRRRQSFTRVSTAC